MDVVVPSPEGYDRDVHVDLDVTGPRVCGQLPLDHGAVSGELDGVGVAVLAVGPPPMDVVRGAGREVAGVPGKLVDPSVQG